MTSHVPIFDRKFSRAKVLRAEVLRTEVLAGLRRLLPRLDSVSRQTRALAFGIPALDRHLPQGGLGFGVLHEVTADSDEEIPAAFGFLMALLGRMPQAGPLLLVVSRAALGDNVRPYGHGLHRLGLDPARLIVVETANDRQALWAIEESLRSNVPAAVAGAIATSLDLKTSQRLHLAAGESGIPLLLMKSAYAMEASVAVTRWRVAAAAAARDRFGLVERWRWNVKLERCRNGRPGEWLVEFDHAYRFSLAAALAHPPVSLSTGAQVRISG